MLQGGWVLGKRRFLKIRGRLNHKGGFPQEIHSLRASSAANCVWLLPLSLPHSAFLTCAVSALHTHIHHSLDPPCLNEPQGAPRDTHSYTQPTHTKDWSWIPQHRLRSPKNCLTRILSGNLGPSDLKQASISLTSDPEAWSLRAAPW